MATSFRSEEEFYVVRIGRVQGMMLIDRAPHRELKCIREQGLHSCKLKAVAERRMPSAHSEQQAVPTAEEPQGRSSNRRWRIAWLLGLGVLVNYFDRVNLSVSHHDLTQEFGISEFTF